MLESSSSDLGLASKIFLGILLAFFFGLSFFGKSFAMLHFSIGVLPLYVGEIALLICLVWVSLYGRRALLASPRIFLILALSFLVVGVFRTGISLVSGLTEYGLVQILRDSAIYYQSLWILVGLMLDRASFRLVFLGILFGLASSEVVLWIDFLADTVFGVDIVGAFPIVPGGNEVISPLFFLSYAFLNAEWATASIAASGLSLVGQVFSYFKKSWMLSSFGICLPTIVFFSGGVLPKTTVFSRLRGVILAAVVGVGLASLSVSFAISHSIKTEKILGQSRPFTHPAGWIFHGELKRDSEGKIVSPMDWRMHLWRQAWEGFVNSPVIGQGFGPRIIKTFPGEKPAIYNGHWVSGPHNSFLALAFRTGLLGVIPILGMVLFPFVLWLRKWRAVPWLSISVAAFASVASYASFNVCLENPQCGIFFWLFLGASVRLSIGENLEKKC